MNERGHILTILLTGGIGSGKSLAAKCLVALGVPVYDFDSRTKELYDSDPELCRRVAEAVGPYTEEKVLTEEGRLDRRTLAYAVFGNSAALEALEAVVHPAALADFRKWRGTCERQMVAAESAIALSKPLFADEFDKVILITAPEDVRKNRVILRDEISETEVERRMCVQSEADMARVDYVIDNNGNMNDLRARLYEIIGKIDPRANERCEREFFGQFTNPVNIEMLK